MSIFSVLLFAAGFAAIAEENPPLVSLAKGQNKYKTGEFKGFTINEHVIYRTKDVFVLRTISGKVWFVDEKGSPMEGALIEIRGPGDCEVFKSANTDVNGYFEIKDLEEGLYLFKVSSLGFNGYAGKIKISRNAKPESPFNIYLQLAF
jgi:hypothetical protein